jgi:hypothetical protein
MVWGCCLSALELLSVVPSYCTFEMILSFSTFFLRFVDEDEEKHG